MAFFNVMEERRQDETDENRKYYQGLPITSAAIALPIVFMLSPILRRDFLVTLHAVVLTIGILFITNFKLKKPKNATLAVLVTIVAIAVLKLFHVG